MVAKDRLARGEAFSLTESSGGRRRRRKTVSKRNASDENEGKGEDAPACSGSSSRIAGSARRERAPWVLDEDDGC